MTQQEQNQQWYKWNRFQQKYEKYFEKKFVKALHIQLAAYIKTRDVMAIPSYPLWAVLNELYLKVGPAWANITRIQTKKAIGQMGFNEEIVRLMRQYYGINLMNDAELMTAYSREVIADVLSLAAETGASIDDIVKSLLTNPEFNAMRARRIARTETVTAANGAAMIYAQQSGNVMEKIWIAVKDKRTRHNHKMIDGTTLPIDVPFDFKAKFKGGGYIDVQMMQPGARFQPNGLKVPGTEVINCRCTVAFQAKRDAAGRIVRR
jgi:uncharacterized protein with gpF-like domain